jgi:uncharacterized protein YqeY
MFKEKINSDYFVAFRLRNETEKNLLSLIKGEIQTQEKKDNVQHLSDENVLKILNKMAKSLNETLTILSNQSISGEKYQKVSDELQIIKRYLPKELSVDEINQKLDELISSGLDNLGLIMKEFSTLPVDKKMVSELVKTKLNK